MLPFENYYEFESWLNQNGADQERWMSSVKSMDGGDSTISSASKLEMRKSTEASRSHKEAERRRRQRINAHLSTLRTLLPNTTKTDKASLLAEVVNHLKNLRKQAADIASQNGKLCSSGSEPNREEWSFPSEFDESSLSYCDNDAKLMKAIVCCEDRPSLARDLTQAIRSVQASEVRAEMMTVGGRTKNVVVLKWTGGCHGGDEHVGDLRRALKAVVENRASGSGLAQHGSGNKRARIFSSLNGDNQ